MVGPAEGAHHPFSFPHTGAMADEFRNSTPPPDGTGRRCSKLKGTSGEKMMMTS